MSSGPTFKFPLGSHGEVLPVCHSCWCLHRGNVWIDQDRLNASFFPVIWLMFSNLLKVMFATGFEEQEATTKSPQNKDVHFLGGNQTQRNQYSNSIVISVYSGGPSPAHQQWIPERFSSGSLHKKMNRTIFSLASVAGGIPLKFYSTKIPSGQIGQPIPILGHPQAEIAKKSSQITTLP